MLILSRKSGERIRIADDIVIVVKEIKGNLVRIGIAAEVGLRATRRAWCDRW